MPAVPGARSRVVLALIWLVVGTAMVAVPLWVGWSRWQVLLTGHPAMMALTATCLLAGLVAVAWAVAELALGERADAVRAGPRRRRTREQLEHNARLRIAAAVPALWLSVILVVTVAYLRPFPAAPPAVRAARSSETVRLTDRLTWFELAPTKRNESGRLIKPSIGLLFSPGARVDPRAYASVLAPLAAEGNLVIVLKEPFGLPIADPGHAARAMNVHPEIASWVVGGHSLGGVVAAAFAAEHAEVKGLLLFGAYPRAAVSRSDLRVTSVSGSADELVTPTEVDKAKVRLPADTRYVVIDGANHAFFGDYGEQPRDGTPTVDRAAAHAQITEAARRLLAGFIPPPPKKK